MSNPASVFECTIRMMVMAVIIIIKTLYMGCISWKMGFIFSFIWGEVKKFLQILIPKYAVYKSTNTEIKICCNVGGSYTF